MPENNLPSFEELFGNLDFQNADEYRSVLSPAAYLTDIMNLKNWRYDHDNIDEIDAVDDRREDISEILLNKENTITEIPHLDVVNDIMERRVKVLNNDEEPYESLKSAQFPFNLPFNRAHTEIGHLFGYLKTSPTEFYRLFKDNPDVNTQAREALGLSTEEYSNLITPVTDEAGLLVQYGANTGEALADLSKLMRFRKATEMSAIQVLELLYQDLSNEEKDTGGSSRFYINSQAAGGAWLVTDLKEGEEEEQLYLRTVSGTTVTDTAPPPEYLDRVNRFIRTSRKTDLSFADLDLIIMKGCGGQLDENAMQIIAVVKWLLEKYELPVEELCTLFAGIKDYGKGENTVPDDLFNRMFNNGRSSDIQGLTGAELKNRLQAGLGLSENDYDSIAGYLADYLPVDDKEITPDPVRLALPFRIKMLAEFFEIEADSLFTLFSLIDKNYQLLDKAKFPLPLEFQQTLDHTGKIISLEETTGAAAIDNTKNILWLVQLSAVMMQWLNDYEMTVEQLEFICTEYSQGEVEDIPSNEEIVDLFRELAGQFKTEMFAPELIVSALTDQLTAAAMMERLKDIETGMLSRRGLVRGLTTASELSPVYKEVIREKLTIEAADLAKTGLTDEEMTDLILLAQGEGFIDLDGYVSTADDKIAILSDPLNVENFLPGTDRAIAAVVFRELADRAKNYQRSHDAAEAEAAAIAEKISIQAGRQQAVLLGTLEGTLNLTSDILRILLVTLFTTIDETEQMATVRFMGPVLDAIDNEADSGELRFNASLLTSFRRLLQFSLLVLKTDLRARELEVLFYIRDVQDSLPEKLKLPAPFNTRIDAMYSNADGDVYIFNADQYIRFSGKDYSFVAKGNISELDEIPAGFSAGIDAAVRDWAPQDNQRQSYLFSGNQFVNTRLPDNPEETTKYWGRVRNNIVEQNHVDAAYLSADKNLFLFSGDQYVKYSDASRDYVDEGYPKRTMQHWNNENQVQLPVEIRKQVDSIFLDSDEKAYFFSGDKFISSDNPSSVQRTQNRWGQVINNIVDNNHVDAVLVNGDTTYMFSGDQYTRYSSADYTYSDEGYPRKIVNNWNNEAIMELGGDYLAKVDAAFTGTDSHTYLFNGNTWVGSSDSQNPAAVNEKWGKVLNNIELNNVVDAALVRDGATYLFSGDQYFKYSGGNYQFVDEGYPKKLARWNSMEDMGVLPDSFNTGLSAALVGRDNTAWYFSANQYVGSLPGSQPDSIKAAWAIVRNNIQTNNKLDAGFVSPDGVTYLFSGDQYYRYSTADYSSVDEGYPKKISGYWGNLPASFNENIDAAFIFKCDGVARLYLFSGQYYVRYSSNDYSSYDHGYPRKLGDEHNQEGHWFGPICRSDSRHHDREHRHDRGYGHKRDIVTIFTDEYNGKPRINFFYLDEEGREKLVKYQYKDTGSSRRDRDDDDDEFEHRDYKWTKSVYVSDLPIAPFTSVDAGFSAADGAVYLFSATEFAVRTGDYEGIETPAAVNSKWGIVINRFQELDRIDAAFTTVNGDAYFFCDRQYIKYSGNLRPGESDFYVDESYPRTIATNWANENIAITLPDVFAAANHALFTAPVGTVYAFTGNSFTSSIDSTPAVINEIWGRVENNFMTLNRVDAAFVNAGTTYLFSGDQYTRYSGDYSGYVDEAYPKKITSMSVADGIELATQFPDGIDAAMMAADGETYFIANGKYITASEPATSTDINSKFGIVRNNIVATGLIDAADVDADGVLYLFSGDQYVRYSAGNRDFVDESYPKTIANWNNYESVDIPIVASQGIKAHFTDTDGESYFFVGNDYFSSSNSSALVPINSKWGKVRNNIRETGQVDAALVTPSGRLVLFSGDQYAQYSPDATTHVANGYPNSEEAFTYLDEGYPKRIADNWGDLPADYREGMDAAAMFDGRTYFFKGNTYIRYSDPAVKRFDTGFPRNIAAHMSELPEFLLNDVKTFQQFKELSKVWSYPDNSILQYLGDSKDGMAPAEQLSRLASITKWKEQDITALITGDNILSQIDLADIQALTEMKNIFEAANDMASTPSTIKTEVWDKIYGQNTALDSAASMLSGQLQTVVGAAAWKDLASDLRNTMNAARRDALLDYLIFKMESSDDVDINWIDNPRELYEFLLIDVEMGEEAITSRIQEAIMCMQLFYHRMLINLEEQGFTDETEQKIVKAKLKKWWLWMKNYRVWEANRKVFLYPENYIRPELRLDKSPEFKELEEALLQGDITDKTADDAYKTYLEKYSEVSRLRVSGGYVYQRRVGVEDDDSEPNEKKIIMFGHSNTEPKVYYYMTGDILEETDADTGQLNQSIDWAPWKEIGITIDSEKVYPVFSFNRLFVFWVEVRERDNSKYTTEVGPDQKRTQYDPVIYYSFYNLKGEWTHPQMMFDIGKHVDKLPTSKKELFIDDRSLKKSGSPKYIPARDVLNGARLYVTNPITSRYYDSEEYIYISYDVRYETGTTAHEFTFEGKLKSDLEFEQGQVDPRLVDKLEKNIQFPFDKFGITPVSFNHWKGFHNDAFSAPWFSFNAGGGSFLIKPQIVKDAPVIHSDKKLYGIDWTNLPDSGFKDQSNAKHLFYRNELVPGTTQYYTVLDGDALPVTDVWGKRNIFESIPDNIESVAVNGDKTFIATVENYYLSYTGPDLQYIDQETVAEATVPFTLGQLLPAGATVEQWHRIKEDLGDYLDTLENAFVYSGDSRLYLVANPVNENGNPVREYTIPDTNEFLAELAALVQDNTVADTLRGWTSISSANFYTGNGNRRIYITSGNDVFVKDYNTGIETIRTVTSLTHPDLAAIVYDDTPVGAVEKPWSDTLLGLMEYISRLTGVGNESGSIRLLGKRSDDTDEYTIPVAAELFNAIADIINDPIISPVVAGFTELNAADLYNNGTIKRLYLVSGDVVVLFDYKTGEWSVEDVNDLDHPDVTATVSSLDGLLPVSPAVPWSDVAEDFNEYIATVQTSLVWKGDFYLLTPKDGGGSEYAIPSPAAFWGAVAESLPTVADFSAIDSAGILTEGSNRRLVVTFNEHVVIYDFSSAAWSLSSINQMWGVNFSKLDGLIQAPDGNIYLFYGDQYAEKTNTSFTTNRVESKWGFQPNAIISMVDSAFMDGDGRVYLFSGERFFRYSDINTKVIDDGYPKNIRLDLGVDMDEVKEEFSADKNNVEILNVSTNTAFVQNLVNYDADENEIVNEKMYLFMDVTAKITTYTWRWRWRWWGGWRWRYYAPFIRIRRRAWWGWWWPEYYLEVNTETVRKSVYMRFSRDGDQFIMDADYPKVITGNWSNLPGDFNNMITATFEDVEGSGNDAKDIFYIARVLVEEKDGEDVITNDYVRYVGKENFPKEISEEQYEIIRLTSNTSEVLSQRLFIDGIDGLLSLDTQRIAELPEFQVRTDDEDDLVSGEEDNSLLTLKDRRRNDIVLYKPKYIRSVPVCNTLDFTSINNQYYWEIFFQAPFLIAQAFNNAQKFDESTEWYEHIFDPTEDNDEAVKAFWKFLPFHEDIENDQGAEVNSVIQFHRYLNDPFDPHAIAGLRQIAYRKAIVMAYIDNQVDHGDLLFRRYTRETINEARMLYVLAYDLLGKKPELIGTRRLAEAKTYKQLREEEYGLLMELVNLENNPEHKSLPAINNIDNPNDSLLDPYGYFYIPENREFAEYWERVEDRLFKIRQSLNIEGVKQRLPLFEPPLDVMALVRAVGSGMGLAQALADYNVAIPNYRFSFMLAKARELNSRVVSFGQNLLSALEKKDAEELALLRNTHEMAILELTLDIKEAQLDDAKETLASLRANLKGAKIREGYYTGLLSAGLSPFEQSQLSLLATAQVFTNLSQVFSVMSSVSGIVPEVGAFAFHWGGHNLAALFTGLSQSFGAISGNFNYAANLSSILGGHHRRAQDWGLQRNLASTDIESIERQIAGAEIKIKIAQLDIQTAKTNIKNLESVDTFMKNKFTNQQLYSWMSSKLSGLYFQTYQMALDMAKGAQKAFQFELGVKESEVNYIGSLYWDSLKKGLLAGELLQVDLDRLEKAYIEKNTRTFEISKLISLQQLDPLALLNLQENRVCEFTLSEELFDYDFPGHYCRQIKTISLTFPAVAGVYENVNATLTQLSHRILMEPDKDGVKYLLDPEPGVDQPLSIRADWRTNQQIALSRGVNDAGLFQLNFQDERYLPFEGTGVVSTWRLELNGQENAFDIRTLTDVVFKIEYTALQGGDVFAAAVKKELKPSPEAKVFNLAEDFSAEWNRFMENPAAGLSVKVTREMFPNLGSRNQVSGLYMLFALSKEGVRAIGDTAMVLNDIDVKQATLVDLKDLGKELTIASRGSTWTLLPKTSPEQAADMFTPENISNIALVCTYEKKPNF